jgi:hypothetical protein
MNLPEQLIPKRWKRRKKKLSNPEADFVAYHYIWRVNFQLLRER